jgi:hypothetical protein
VARHILWSRSVATASSIACIRAISHTRPSAGLLVHLLETIGDVLKIAASPSLSAFAAE